MSQGRTQGSLTSVPQTQTFFPTVLIHGEQKKPNPLRLFLYNLKRKKNPIVLLHLAQGADSRANILSMQDPPRLDLDQSRHTLSLSDLSEKC